MWEQIASAGIGAVGSLVGGIIGADRTHKEAKYWANYNSPSEQMKRLSDAGLNPNLVYQNGSALTEAKPVGDPGAQLGQGISQAAQKWLEKLQIDKVKSDIEVNKTQSAKNTADANKSSQETSNLKTLGEIYDSDDYRNQYGSMNRARESQIELNATEQQKKLAETTAQGIENNRNEFVWKLEQEFGRSNAEAENIYNWANANIYRDKATYEKRLLELQVDSAEAGINLSVGRLKECLADIAKCGAMIREINERTEFLKKQGGNVEEDTELKKLQQDYQRTKNNWLDKGINVDHYSKSWSGGGFYGNLSNSTVGDFSDLVVDEKNKKERKKSKGRTYTTKKPLYKGSGKGFIHDVFNP